MLQDLCTTIQEWGLWLLGYSAEPAEPEEETGPAPRVAHALARARTAMETLDGGATGEDDRATPASAWRRNLGTRPTVEGLVSRLAEVEPADLPAADRRALLSAAQALIARLDTD